MLARKCVQFGATYRRMDNDGSKRVRWVLIKIDDQNGCGQSGECAGRYCIAVVLQLSSQMEIMSTHGDSVDSNELDNLQHAECICHTDWRRTNGNGYSAQFK